MFNRCKNFYLVFRDKEKNGRPDFGKSESGAHGTSSPSLFKAKKRKIKAKTDRFLSTYCLYFGKDALRPA